MTSPGSFEQGLTFNECANLGIAASKCADLNLGVVPGFDFGTNTGSALTVSKQRFPRIPGRPVRPRIDTNPVAVDEREDLTKSIAQQGAPAVVPEVTRTGISTGVKLGLIGIGAVILGMVFK